jgi:hypothetical protein
MSYQRKRNKTLYDYVKPSLLKRRGKIVARVLGWESGWGPYKGRYIIPKNPVNEESVPKTALSVDIILFDEDRNPIPQFPPRNISRKELENYEITP